MTARATATPSLQCRRELCLAETTVGVLVLHLEHGHRLLLAAIAEGLDKIRRLFMLDQAVLVCIRKSEQVLVIALQQLCLPWRRLHLQPPTSATSRRVAVATAAPPIRAVVAAAMPC